MEIFLSRDRREVAGTVLICAGLTVALHFPGQMSVDTVIQLYEGSTRTYVSNQPPAMSFLLATLGPGVMLTLIVALFAAAVMVLLERIRATPRQKRIAVIVLFFFPVISAYNGILWKDVLFANLTLLGFLLLPLAYDSRQRRTLILSGALVGIGCAVRQQGLIAAVFAALASLLAVPGPLAWRARFSRLAYWSGGWIGAVVLLGLVVITTAVKHESLAAIGPFYQLVIFDLAGISVRTPGAALPVLDRAGVDRAALQRKFARYGADRVDSLALADVGAADPLYGVPLDTLARAWRSAIRDYPGSYLGHRLEVLGWTLGLHEVRRCLPYEFGISPEPATMVRELALKPGATTRAHALGVVHSRLLSFYRPIAYALIAVIVIGYLAWRDPQRHAAMMLLQMAGLAYVAAYFAIGIACDFRYTYFMVLASVIGVAYAVMNGIADRMANRDASPAVP